ncbi:hypothetical protein BGW38_008051 [Lunasporangiospora selenospora]|uniref:Methyltransferase n=1 Tax=Lunasporangiospora selenospora TaxID=979761 RepID=A0A9P6KGD8_9FUNG|nr:hypothetical protein BGW38_008051 [Lunasporangiospora selenospora]
MTATSPTTTPTVSVAKALLGSRQQRKMSKRPNSGPVSRTAASPTSPSSPTIPTVSGLGSGSGLGSTRVQAPQPKKPIVIHQSLSTLSKPGQTGTVVWDSSIMMAKFLLSIRGLTTNCYAQSIQHRRHRRRSRRQDRSAGNDDSNSNDGTAKETRIKGSAQMQSKAEGEGERVGLQKDAIRKLEEQAEHMIVSENGELLDTLPKLNCGQDLRGELDQDQNIEQAAKGTFVGSGSDSSDGSDYDDEEEDNDEREDANGEGDEGQGRLVFNSAETTILELGSGCGLLGIVMAELCQDLLLTDQSPVLPLLIKNLRKNLDKKYFDRQDGLTSSLSGFAGDGSSSTGGVTSGLTMAESGSLSKAGKKGGRSGKKGSTGNGEDSSVTSARPCLIQVQELVWGQDLDQDLQRGLGVDFVIATDVVYNESVVPKLIQTLEELCQVRERAREGIQSRCGRDYERFLALEESREEDFRSLQAAKGGRSSQGVEAGERQRRRTLDKTVILIAQELRTNYVHQAFIEGLDRAGFVMVRMPQELIDIDYQAGYVIYACFLRSDRTGARIVAI